MKKRYREISDIIEELQYKRNKFTPYRTQYNILVGKYYAYDGRRGVYRLRCSNCNSLKPNAPRYLNLCVDCLKIKSVRNKNRQW
tara:strand:- start:49 stop:300 length:252 start_codon:yes stop_codon:yes gene_type:complete